MRQIIVLKNGVNENGTQWVNYAFWLTVPVAARVALPSFVSQVPSATAAEITALQNGSVVEEIRQSIFTNTASVQNQSISDYNTRQAFWNSQSGFINYSGVYYDGTWH